MKSTFTPLFKLSLIIFYLGLSSGLLAHKQKTLAVMPFKNVQASKAYDYLSSSIPEATITSIGSLKKFQIKKKAEVDAAIKASGVDPKNIDETSGAKVAAQLKADIYVVGSFITDKNSIQMNGRAYDSAGELVAGAKQNADLNDSIFKALDKFTRKLAYNLDEAFVYETTKLVYIDGQAQLVATKNLVTLELAGSSIYGSLNYRRQIMPQLLIGAGGSYIPRADFNAYNIKIGVDYHPFLNRQDWMNAIGFSYEGIFYNRTFDQNEVDFQSFAFGSALGAFYGIGLSQSFFARATAMVIITDNAVLPYAGLSGGVKF